MVDLHERLLWFKSVILPHQGMLRGRFRRIAPPGADIDDLVAETLARAYAAHDWRRITAGRAYLLMIARNMLIDAARRDAVVSFYQFSDFDSLRNDHSPEAALSARDELRQMEKIIAGLPPQPRRAFVLRRVYEHSVGEIADEMGLSVSTVEKHLAKAVTLVVKALAESESWSVERAIKDAEQERGAGGGSGAPGRPGAWQR